MREIRESLHYWLCSVMRERNWTAACWAKRADITPTNLTRFLKDPDRASLPSAETLGRLALAAGSEPKFLSNGHLPAACRVPVLTLEEIHHLKGLKGRREAEEFLADAQRSTGRCVLLDRPTSARAFATRINSIHMNAGGLLPDDRIVIEPFDYLSPQRGDMVITVDGRSICAYRYYPPQLVPVSTDAACCPMFCDGADMVGVAIQVIRSLRH
jgi:hypothetical protein